MTKTVRGVAVAAALTAALGAALFAVGTMNARAAPRVRSAALGLRDWPAQAPPFRIVLISDVHMGDAMMTPARLDGIVARINALRPDLVVVAGDLINGHTAEGAQARAADLIGPFSRVEARGGVVAVLGNHDHWTSASAVRAALTRAGVVVLENQAVGIGPIALAGVGDVFSGHDDADSTIAQARRLGRPVVVLTHSPDLAGRLPSDARLVLAGHTHCGQVRAPWGAALIARSPRANGRALYDPRYRCGLIRDGERDVVVTAGVGAGTLPVRFGAPPDLWLLTLGPASVVEREAL